MTGSIWSYPDRGPWGNARYRGNCSGHLVGDLLRCLGSRSMIDPCVGSGTSVEVAREMGVQAVGLDLHSGFNLLRDSIAEVAGGCADLVFSHPPYGDMIQYSGVMYPGEHPDDLSRCADVEEFLEKMSQALLNQRDATVPGGHYATLVGDQRKQGRYISYQAELIARMPRDELQGVIIKAQHNCQSNSNWYVNIGGGLPRISQEYLLVWRRPNAPVSLLGTLHALADQAASRLRSTWRAIVRQALVSVGGEADLSTLYGVVERNAGDRVAFNPNWKAKVRQTLQLYEGFRPLGSGRWALA